MRVLAAIFSVMCLGACSATEGVLLVRRDLDGESVDASASQPWVAVRADMALQYQISGELDTGVMADLFVSDLFDTRASQVATLHAERRVVMGYVSVGSLERWRDDVDEFPRTAVGETLANYPEEAWLDIRSAEVAAAMRARFDLARQKGFDGVYASTVGGYRAHSGFALTQADELAYLKTLVAAAHERGLSIGLSGDFELSELPGAFDWAIAIGCVAADTCQQLAPLSAAKRPVFDVELDGERDVACRRAAEQGFSVIFKRRQYDAYRATCP